MTAPELSVADEIDIVIKQIDGLVGLIGSAVVTGEETDELVRRVAQAFVNRRSDLMRWSRSVRAMETADAGQEAP